jgi:signal transduction histidine kinase
MINEAGILNELGILNDFFRQQLDYIFFFYGLSFIILSAVCFTMRKDEKQQMPWCLLGLFGLTHGINEWLDLAAISLYDSPSFANLRFYIMTLSFIFLVEFGRMGTIKIRGKGSGRWIFLPLLLAAAAGNIAGSAGANAASRYALGLTGGLWTMYVLLSYSGRFQKYAGKWLAACGAAFGLYGIATGFVVPQASFFPASLINTHTFFETLGLPIQLIRGLLAMFAATTIWGFAQARHEETLKRYHLLIRHSSILWLFLSVTAILAGGWVITDFTGRHKMEELHGMLNSRVVTAASSLDPAVVIKKDAAYLSTRLKLICAANDDCISAYVIGLKDGELFYIAKTDTDHGHGHHADFKEASGKLKELFKTGQSYVECSISDHQHKMLAGVAPVKDEKTGRIIAALGIDIDIKTWAKDLAFHRLVIITGAFNMCVLAIVFFIGWQRTKESETELAAANVLLHEKEESLKELNKSLESMVEGEIEKRRQHEHMLIQQSKLAAMGEMISAIAHQWRQPLNAVGLIIQNIKDAYEYGELDKKYLDKSVETSMNQIQFMSKTIDDFRNFFRPDKEKIPFDVKQTAGEVLAMFSSQLKANNISYRVVCHAHDRTFEDFTEIISCGEMTLIGYQNEFKQAFLNLITNAKDAIIERRQSGDMDIEEKGVISFDFEKSGEKIIIRITDNGGGIPEDIIDRVFEPYFTTKEQGRGTGIGLYMSKVIIENNMGGSLTVKNINGGAEFRIEV